MTTRVSTFSLRLPVSLKAAIEKLAEADGTSMNQFLVMAAAEKLTAPQNVVTTQNGHSVHANAAAGGGLFHEHGVAAYSVNKVLCPVASSPVLGRLLLYVCNQTAAIPPPCCRRRGRFF